MAGDPCAPWLLGADTDADARAPRHVANREPAILDVNSIAGEINAILFQRDSHRHRQIARTAAELVSWQTRRIDTRTAPFHRAPAAPTHHLDAVDRIERADENRRRR